ncbi:MAG: DUF814 domain-containing protein [Spirochaetales bacterium]|nr:DUF814 domain-containing protein [Spirochaetales bacterium]
MSLNWKEIDLILEELALQNAMIQDCHQPKPPLVIFNLYRPSDPFSLMISLETGLCRMHRLNRKMKNPSRPQRFAGFLKANLRGARILEARQLGTERIVKIHVAVDERELIIWLRLWSNAANMIVTDMEGNILDAAYRRPQRGEISGGFYNPEKENLGQNAPKKDFTIRDYPENMSFNQFIEESYDEKRFSRELEALHQQAANLLQEKENYLKAHISTIRKKLDDEKGAEELLQRGDLIKNNLYQIKKGAKEIELSDYFNDNRTILIKLNPLLSPMENAEKYYSDYKKELGNRKNSSEKLVNLESQLVWVQEERSKLDTRSSISELKELLLLLDKPKTGLKDKSEALPGLLFFSGTYQLRVGRTAKENDYLLRRQARGNDFWFHCRDYPGAYVFVRTQPGKTLPLEVMLDAGNLALLYSKAKQSGQADIYYTQVKYLRRPRDGKTGLVLPTQEKNLHIKLDAQRIQRLKKEKSL